MNVIKQPERSGELLTLTKRTLVLLATAVLGIIFCLLTALFITYHVYQDARSDLTLIRAQNTCAREVNAKTSVASGEMLIALGELDSQLGVAIRTLVTRSETTVTDFANEAGKLQPLAEETSRKAGILDAALSEQAQVNATCADPESITTGDTQP